MKKIDLVWSVSLMLIGVATVILAGANVVGIELPDAVSRLAGAVELCALPLMAWSTVKKVRRGKE